MAEEDPEILKRNTIYDVSQASREELCEKINETTSQVFQEFEVFFERELGLKLKAVQAFS